jgi:hypothetical protein
MPKPNAHDTLLAIKSIRDGLQLIDASLEILAAYISDSEVAMPGKPLIEVFGEEALEEETPFHLQQVADTYLYYASGRASGTVGTVDDILSDPDWVLEWVDDDKTVFPVITLEGAHHAFTRLNQGDGHIQLREGDDVKTVSR